MNIDTGQIYPDLQSALDAGVSEDKLVTGTKKAIEELSQKIRFKKNPFGSIKNEVERNKE